MPLIGITAASEPLHGMAADHPTIVGPDYRRSCMDLRWGAGDLQLDGFWQGGLRFWFWFWSTEHRLRKTLIRTPR